VVEKKRLRRQAHLHLRVHHNDAVFAHAFTQRPLRNQTLRYAKLHVSVLLVAWKSLHIFLVKATTCKSTPLFLSVEVV